MVDQTSREVDIVRGRGRECLGCVSGRREPRWRRCLVLAMGSKRFASAYREALCRSKWQRSVKVGGSGAVQSSVADGRQLDTMHWCFDGEPVEDSR